MLQPHSPGFTWEGALYAGQEQGPEDSTVDDFQVFLRDDNCPPFLRADVTRCEVQYRDKESSRQRGRTHDDDDESRGEGNAAPQAPDSESDDEPEPSSYFELLRGSGRECMEEDGPSNLRKPNFNILQMGNSDYVQYDRRQDGSVPVPLQCNLDSAQEWWESVTQEAKKSMTANWSPDLSWDDLMRANTEQRLIITTVLKTCQQLVNGEKDVSPCHLIVAGTAGTGKSFVLKSCTFLVQNLFRKAEAVRVAAFTGSAAAQVGGTTIHSLLKLNPNAGSSGRESDSALLGLQKMCDDLIMLQIDERSMLSPGILGKTHLKLQRGYKRNNLPFGGIPILILYGDDGQLPPPCATPLYDRSGKEKSEEEKIGKLMYVNIKNAVYLSQMVRQQAAPCHACPSVSNTSINNPQTDPQHPSIHPPGQNCDYFPRLLHRMRFGTTTQDDWKWMQYRQLTAISSRDVVEGSQFRDARTLWLVPTRAMAHNTNLERLEELHVKLVDSHGIGYAWVCPLSSVNTGRLAKRAFGQSEDFGSLPSQTWLCRDMPVIMTSNVCQKWDLFNGAVGRVVDIIFREGEGPSADGTSWPRMLLVDFPRYSGPPFFEGFPHLVPVFPGKFEEKGSSREMFPIKVGFCLTCHKAQGFTCGCGQVYERVVVNLGPESVETWGSGLGFVASSRCTSPNFLAFNGDLTGSRVERITKGKAVDKVREEDKRLMSLHERTVTQLQGQDYETLVDWALTYIQNQNPVQSVSDVEPDNGVSEDV